MEKKAGEFIISQPKMVIHLSVQRLAELAEVSESTIIRLSRSLNYTGFKELKLKIAADLAGGHSYSDSYQEIHGDNSISEISSSLTNNNIKSIQDTMKLLSIEMLEQAIHVLKGARKIVLFGVGTSAIIAEDFKQKLTRINRWCESGYGFDLQATLASNLEKEDVVLGISYSGQTEDIIKSLHIAKRNGAKIITLTRFSKNPVSNLADIRLYTSSLEYSIRSGAMASRIAQLNIIDVMYVGIAANISKKSVD